MRSVRMPLALMLLCAAALALSGCSGAQTSADALLVELERNGNTDIYLIGLDGSSRTNLSNHPAWDGTPCWSPDGRQVAFASDREGSPDIYVMDVDGSNVRRLTSWDATEFMPAWSPDGKRIAFASDRAYEERREGGTLTVEAGPEIWIMNADGSQPTRLTGGPDDIALYPEWSSDGRQIVYQHVGERIDLISTDPVSRITRNLTETSPLMSWTPAWSPRGDALLFMGDDGSKRDIYVMNQMGGEVRNLTDHPASDVDPAWSADGQQIAFISDRTGSAELFVMDAQGGNLRQITREGVPVARPAWRPMP
ncbi:MAG: hypothetical protein GX605_00850 [Chloroflexi bacterium]|nr:hypothetical protein [Chloroflexota bacterium]